MADLAPPCAPRTATNCPATAGKRRGTGEEQGVRLWESGGCYCIESVAECCCVGDCAEVQHSLAGVEDPMAPVDVLHLPHRAGGEAPALRRSRPHVRHPTHRLTSRDATRAPERHCSHYFAIRARPPSRRTASCEDRVVAWRLRRRRGGGRCGVGRVRRCGGGVASADTSDVGDRRPLLRWRGGRSGRAPVSLSWPVGSNGFQTWAGGGGRLREGCCPDAWEKRLYPTWRCLR